HHASRSITQPHVDVGTVNRSVATSRPAGPHTDKRGMIDLADKKRARASLHLRMAAQAKVDVSLRQQLGIDRAVRIMTRGTTFTQCRMFEHERPRLLAVTPRTTLVESGHRQSSGGFENIAAMRVMTLRAVYFVLH